MVSPWTRSNSFVGLGPLQDRQLGATVVERDGILTGVAIFATQGSFGPEDITRRTRAAVQADTQRAIADLEERMVERMDAKLDEVLKLLRARENSTWLF